MKDDRELFDLIRDNYSLVPQEDFVLATEIMLRKEAKKLAKKRRYKRYSFIVASMAFCLLIASWITLFNGQETISQAISELGQNELIPAAMPEANQQEPVVYIYHTYNYDSFLPELNEKDANNAFDESKNITLVGKHLKDSLIERNINVIHETMDFERELDKKGLTSLDQYLLARESITKALNTNENIKMIFDIHRDNTSKDESTIVLNGKEFARVTFFLSKSSQNYKETRAFADLIHKKLEERYPNLSKGIILSDGNYYNADYNQDLLNQSALLTIGGVENTLEEEYRTAEVLADIIKELLEE